LLKVSLIIVLVIVLALTATTLALYFNHQSKLKNEAKLHSPPGELVQVNNHLIHVYSEGQGDETFVFLSGHGTTYPTLDFKPLWQKLSDSYRIVVIERPGYGWSDISDQDRDIGTILSETRHALSSLGVEGPYILVPHSMAGLEAIYWSQEYPNEVKAIIGLDPLIPSAVDLLPKISKAQLNITYFMSRIGLTRLMPEKELANNLPILDFDLLSAEDKEAYIALFYKSSLTKNMIDEVRFLSDNADIIVQNDMPIDTPMYFFISKDQSETITGWKEALEEFIDGITYGQTMELSTGHYVHYEYSQVIMDEILIFLSHIQ